MDGERAIRAGEITGPVLSARDRRPTVAQILIAVGLIALCGSALILAPRLTALVAINLIWGLYLLLALWRLIAIVVSRPKPAVSPPMPRRAPRYTVVAALRHEAEMIPQLVARLSRLDYPRDRLEGFLALEIDDAATIAAALACPRPDWLKVLIVPAGTPRTKPRALNYALSRASGDLITVYDAEDEPDPGQLKAAAARFAAAPPTLACLQAPLRIRRHPQPGSPILDRQFAVEYAALFEVIAPALTRLGLPFPLGGTSNHFRVEVLREIGGWDPWNVTEDADLGFRLWRHGYRTGVIAPPTWETPPGRLDRWLPQRTRWLKGFMQTWGVHTRDLRALGWRGLLALALTLGQTIVSAAVHGVTTAWAVAMTLSAWVVGMIPATPLVGLTVLVIGAAASLCANVVGARRAGIGWSVTDLIYAPLYWTLLTQAFAHALWRLITQPHAWDKTPHTPEPTKAPNEVDDRTGRRAA